VTMDLKCELLIHFQTGISSNTRGEIKYCFDSRKLSLLPIRPIKQFVKAAVGASKKCSKQYEIWLVKPCQNGEV
jgi:hypothetical protein